MLIDTLAADAKVTDSLHEIFDEISVPTDGLRGTVSASEIRLFDRVPVIDWVERH